MSRKLICVALLAGFSMVGMTACKSEVDNKPAATVTDPKPADAKPADDKPAADPGAAKAPEAPAAAAKDLEVDAAASSIEWVGAKVTGDHKGGFKAFTGKASLNDKGELDKISFEVDTKSVFSDNEKLTGHLMSADFFDVEKFPTATFASTAIAAKPGDNGATHEITGDMELHGVKKTVAFPAKVSVEGGKVSAEADFKINRFDFDIKYAGKADDLIKEEVGLTIKLATK